jgi:hypothetical protein
MKEERKQRGPVRGQRKSKGNETAGAQRFQRIAPAVVAPVSLGPRIVELFGRSASLCSEGRGACMGAGVLRTPKSFFPHGPQGILILWGVTKTHRTTEARADHQTASSAHRSLSPIADISGRPCSPPSSSESLPAVAAPPSAASMCASARAASGACGMAAACGFRLLLNAICWRDSGQPSGSCRKAPGDQPRKIPLIKQRLLSRAFRLKTRRTIN